jgi:hypothetical protein
VRAVHEHFRFDDRHEAGLLAQRRVAGERVPATTRDLATPISAWLFIPVPD